MSIAPITKLVPISSKPMFRQHVSWRVPAYDESHHGDGGVTFPDLIANYYEQAKGLIEGGADILLLETCQDTRNIKAGLVAIDRLGPNLAIPCQPSFQARLKPPGPCWPSKPPMRFTLHFRTRRCWLSAKTA
jgi:hypothetical protein